MLAAVPMLVLAVPVVLLPAAAFVQAILLAGAAHLALCLTGPRRGGLNVTLSTLMYAQCPMVLLGIPICGYYLSFAWQLWALVLGVIGLWRAQQVSGGRAALAVLWLPVLVLLGTIALVVVSILHP